MKPTVKEWTRFETAAMAMIDALPFKDEPCRICGGAIRDDLIPEGGPQQPRFPSVWEELDFVAISHFVWKLDDSLLQWEKGGPMRCYYCSEEENDKQVMAEAGFNW